MHDDPDTVAMRAREIVLAGYADDGAAAVAGALASEDAELRARAVSASHRRGRRSVAERIRALRDDAAVVRRRACELEARTPRRSTKVEAALVACLADGDALVVVAAADALGEANASSAVGALSAVATSHGDARCREAAIAALGAIGDAEGLDAVLRGLEDKPAVRRRSVVALAAFNGPLVESALASALQDRDWQVRQAAEALLTATTAPPA